MNVSKAAPLDRYAYELSTRSGACRFAEAFTSGFFYTVTLTGNSLVLWFVYRNTSLRTIPNFFVISLAIADILMGASSCFMCLKVLVEGYWPFSDFLCQFQGFKVAVLACISLQTMTLTAVNRYYLVIRPNTYRGIFSRRNTKLMIIGVWVLACTEPLPYLISGHRYVFHPGKYFCFQTVETDFVSLLIYVYIAVPTIILTPCYYKVFKGIRSHNKQMVQAKTVSPGLSVTDIKVTNALFFTVCGFLVCWVPIGLVDVIDIAIGNWTLPRQVYFMYTLLGQASTAINPFIYGLMNPNFRREYVKLFRWLTRPLRLVKWKKQNSVGAEEVQVAETKQSTEIRSNIVPVD